MSYSLPEIGVRHHGGHHHNHHHLLPPQQADEMSTRVVPDLQRQGTLPDMSRVLPEMPRSLLPDMPRMLPESARELPEMTRDLVIPDMSQPLTDMHLVAAHLAAKMQMFPVPQQQQQQQHHQNNANNNNNNGLHQNGIAGQTSSDSDLMIPIKNETGRQSEFSENIGLCNC